MLEWHRLQGAGDGVAACALLTDEQQAAAVKLDREMMNPTEPARDCAAAIARYGGFSDSFRTLMLNTRVDAVRIDGDRATATAHTSTVVNGAARQTPAAQIPLRWVGGRWLID